MEKLDRIEEELRKYVLGQDHVVARVASLLKRGELGLTNASRPKGSFLFLGPTGVGKTELALSFTRYLLGEERLFRFDMSEFMHFDSVKEFIGHSGNPGRLGNVLENNKAGACLCLLFDEMEKAHPQILLLFLQMLDAARITLGNGRTYDLSGFYIVFTSNIGSENILQSKRVPFATIERSVLAQLHLELRPEFIARIDEKIVFKKLEYHTQREIAVLLLERELSRLRDKGYALSYDDSTLEFLVRKGIDRIFGARPLRNAIERHVQDALARRIIAGKPPVGVIRYCDKLRDLIVVNI
ncbi:MAG TPA: ATP-dependent Clp protease ATP-binding subunit [Lentisphaeria bacterium]|nr:MAG: hypothetical protein A2X48_07510 [Lentisphaerae bacterium GWF2_49_21]HBC86489.1 ATP-dependent Clp protease ATP-binding subunit [Lentisphaeria bacterium]